MSTASDAPRVELAHLGWDAGWAAVARSQTAGVSGRVTRVDRGVCTVLTTTGALRAGFGGPLLGRIARDAAEAPCAGDWVSLRRWPDARVTAEAVLPRRTSVVRAEAGLRARGQVLAANATVVAVTVALDQTLAMTRVERLLALAWDSGATPAVVLTKADVAADAPGVAADIADCADGVTVICVSAVTGEGIADVHRLVAPAGTLALIGSSGAGKSTLVNALVGAPVLRTRTIREDGRGRHTTARRELVVLPAGGCVIDTPGLRGVGLFDTSTGLSQAFPDVAALARLCRFSDCVHGSEPGCAVVAAVESGALPPRRLESWRKLGREQRWMSARRDARLRAQRTRLAQRVRR